MSASPRRFNITMDELLSVRREPDGKISVRRVVPDPPPVEDQGEARRCECCGAPMPADVGSWILAPAIAGMATVGVLVLCSPECDKQLWEVRP